MSLPTESTICCDASLLYIMLQDNLLTTLLDVVCSISSQPSCFVSFPSTGTSEPIIPQPVSIPRVDSDGSISSKTALTPSTDPSSPWVVAPMQLTCKSSLTWPPVGKGFSMIMWLRVEEKRNGDPGGIDSNNPRKIKVKSKSSNRLFPRIQSLDNISKIPYYCDLTTTLQKADILLFFCKVL